MMEPFAHPAHSFLEGTVVTSVPGHRLIRIGSTSYQLPDGEYWFSDLITASDTAISGSGWSVARSDVGAVTFTKDSGSETDLKFPDSLGRLFGFRAAVSELVSGSLPFSSDMIPRACIPLLGATWDAVDLVRETHFELTRFRRVQAYTWGSARVWRWRLTMSRVDLQALESGWLLRSRVKIVGSDSSAISSSNPDGAMAGYVMGIESRRWIGPVQDVAEVVLLVAGSGT